MTYRMPTLGISGLLGKDLAALGIPTEEELVRQYCARTKRSSIEHLNFYLAFSLFRYAGILHGIRGRVLSGTATSSRARRCLTRRGYRGTWLGAGSMCRRRESALRTSLVAELWPER